jgi:hypothetical protein
MNIMSKKVTDMTGTGNMTDPSDWSVEKIDEWFKKLIGLTDGR